MCIYWHTTANIWLKEWDVFWFPFHFRGQSQCVSVVTPYHMSPFSQVSSSSIHFRVRPLACPVRTGCVNSVPVVQNVTLTRTLLWSKLSDPMHWFLFLRCLFCLVFNSPSPLACVCRSAVSCAAAASLSLSSSSVSSVIDVQQANHCVQFTQQSDTASILAVQT